MDFSKFQVAVIEIASEGTRLTTANVVARLRVDPVKAEAWLDRMAREGRLDLEVDETEGVVVYHVRGLTPWRGPRSGPSTDPQPRESDVKQALRRLESSMEIAGTALSFGKPFSKPMRLPPSLRRSVPLGFVLGGLFPGAGLAYAAPWPVVAISTLIVISLGFKLLPLLLAVPFLIVAAAGSAILGAVYAWRYNQAGKRAPLLEPEEPRMLPRRF